MKNQPKKNPRPFWPAFLTALLVIGMAFFISCNSGNSKNAGSGPDSTNTSPTGPAPDNSAATNPSSADTAFQKDSARRKP